MRVAIASDEKTSLTDYLLEELRVRGHEVVPYGALSEVDADRDWPIASASVAEAVARGSVDHGIVCCWTGTGASIAANKVPNVRAALCHDAETARGARIYNHANVLALSLRLTSPAIAKEILEAWFSTPWSSDDWNVRQVERVRALEAGAQQGSAAAGERGRSAV